MITRRGFFRGSITALAAAMLPHAAFAQVAATTRVEWKRFAAGPLLPHFEAAIRRMRDNTDALDPGSLAFWNRAHSAYCPHGRSWFLAWHRGLLHGFEAQLRRLSGRADLVLPYWDYYADPRIPARFNDPASPLHESRKTSSVAGALSFGAFGARVTNFQLGLPDAFEPSLEILPHNQVHNLVGFKMGGVATAPLDPLFWVHHANIDRLWAAWMAAGAGRTMPSPGDAYWNGDHSYGPGVSVPVRQTYSTAALAYDYDDVTLPVAPTPPMAPKRPPSAALASIRSEKSNTVFSLGGRRGLELDEASVNVDIAVPMGSRRRDLKFMVSPMDDGGFTSASVVLEDVRLTDLGREGGYYYKIYVNLPKDDAASSPEAPHLLGTLGAFEIEAAMHASGHDHDPAHADAMEGANFRFPLTEALRTLSPDRLNRLAVSFIRVDGDGEGERKGKAIDVGEIRIEASNAPIE